MGNNNLISSKKTYYISIAILAGMFFIFGFVSWVNAILIPYFRISCELTHFESYFVRLCILYRLLCNGYPLGSTSQKSGIQARYYVWFYAYRLRSFLICSGSISPSVRDILAGLFSIGTGLAILQTAANPYVTIIGPIDSAARRISIYGNMQ